MDHPVNQNSGNPVHVAIVDDEPITRTLIRKYIESDYVKCSEAQSAAELERLIASAPVDVVLLDIMLPDKDGFTLTRELRAKSDIGIILISKIQQEHDRILGLELGADDYLSKPFNPRELLARIRSILRRMRSGSSNDLTPVVRFDDWMFDLNARTLNHRSGSVTRLTNGEYQILSILIQHPGKVVSRDRLATISDPNSLNGSYRSVDVLISRLRRKLLDNPKDPKYLITVHGEGYIFAPQPY